MKSKTKLLSIASAAGLALAVGLVSCAKDELKEVAGEYLGFTFTTSVTRATPTTLTNLDAFDVYADADGYSNLLIDGLTATKKENTGDYVLDKNVIWPADVNKIRFWAYGPSKVKNNVTANFSAMSQALNDIEVKPDFQNGGKDHQDLVVAYTHAERDKTTGMRVPLTFHHAMSQIEVRLKLGQGAEDDGYVVKVKGAWMMGVHSKGTLAFEESSDANHMKWTTNTSGNYGRYVENGASLTSSTTVNMISNESGSDNSSLMVLPQKFIKYKFDNSSTSTTADEETTTKNLNIGDNPSGTYIMVLCRVEVKHSGEASSDDSQANTGVKPDGDGHIHQLFPISKDNMGDVIFKEDAYGYTSVPISGEWLPGKKYIYTLEFCGSNSGAGVYPPVQPDEPEGVTPPDDKKPGDPVLDSPITFSVTVEDWKTPEGWDDKTPMP